MRFRKRAIFVCSTAERIFRISPMAWNKLRPDFGLPEKGILMVVIAWGSTSCFTLSPFSFIPSPIEWNNSCPPITMFLAFLSALSRGLCPAQENDKSLPGLLSDHFAPKHQGHPVEVQWNVRGPGVGYLYRKHDRRAKNGTQYPCFSFINLQVIRQGGDVMHHIICR